MAKKLKGLKKVNRIINGYLDKFGVTADIDTDFMAYLEDRKITYALAVVDDADKYFIPFVKKLAPYVEADIFLISLFHEVGHIYTQFNFSEETWDAGWRAKDDLQGIIDETDDEEIIYEQNMRYFNLPEEKAATEWGLNYIQTHAEEVEEFWNELQPAIMRFYEKNELL